MRSFDVAVIGAGIVGLSLALKLRRSGADVIVIDRVEPAREASYAAGGMIAHCDPHTPEALQPLAIAGARMYPEFVHELEDESQTQIEFRRDGVIAFFPEDEKPQFPSAVIGKVRALSPEEVTEAEPGVAYRPNAWFLPENFVDPHTLMNALLKAARHHGVEVVSGSPVEEVVVANERAAGVRTDKTTYGAAAVVNCAGAWGGQIAPLMFPVRPVKGQIVCVVFQHHSLAEAVPQGTTLRHVVRAGGLCYIVPRTGGRLVIGSTMEDAGFDKRVLPDAIQGLHQAAALLVPQIGEARILEAWAGLRPGTPDRLPIMGATAIPGYFISTGHFRDGIMLAPSAAEAMAAVIKGRAPEIDISAFGAGRFGV